MSLSPLAILLMGRFDVMFFGACHNECEEFVAFLYELIGVLKRLRNTSVHNYPLETNMTGLGIRFSGRHSSELHYTMTQTH